MWQITRHIVDSRTANRLVFLSNVDQLKEYLELSVSEKEEEKNRSNVQSTSSITSLIE